jgi:hypothetical protein
LLAQGLFLDLDLPAARAWKNSQPRLDDATVTRLRGLVLSVTTMSVGTSRNVSARPR